jgi:hypothetical protein
MVVGHDELFGVLERDRRFESPSSTGESLCELTAIREVLPATHASSPRRNLSAENGMVTRQEALDHASAIVAATDLPVSADLDKGFDDAPAGTAETIRLAATVGLVGCSIEDFTGDPQKPLFDLNHAKERVAAAAEAARKLPFRFTLTARAENFLRGNPHLEDTIQRLQAFEAVGARTDGHASRTFHAFLCKCYGDAKPWSSCAKNKTAWSRIR